MAERTQEPRKSVIKKEETNKRNKLHFILEQATKAQRGSRGTWSSALLLTSALDRGGWSTPRFGRFTQVKGPLFIVQDAGWAPGTS
jgi:hypothetical protein